MSRFLKDDSYNYLAYHYLAYVNDRHKYKLLILNMLLIFVLSNGKNLHNRLNRLLFICFKNIHNYSQSPLSILSVNHKKFTNMLIIYKKITCGDNLIKENLLYNLLTTPLIIPFRHQRLMINDYLIAKRQNRSISHVTV